MRAKENKTNQPNSTSEEEINNGMNMAELGTMDPLD